jgi:hypothetical protein
MINRRKGNMIKYNFELIIQTIERDIPILAISLLYIRRFLAPYRIIFVAARNCIEILRRKGIIRKNDEVIFEDQLASGLSPELLKKLLKGRDFDTNRAGWYFKQIANIYYAIRPDAGKYYLVWDADTIPLRDMGFFDDEGRTILDRKTEYCMPYFDTLRRLVGIERQVDFSFIAEHMMFERDIVKAFLSETMGNGYENDAVAFAGRVIDSISNDKISGFNGFAEYETYGNYATLRFPQRITTRDSPSLREGYNLCKWPPSKVQLFGLSQKYYWVSFESWNTNPKRFHVRARHAIKKIFFRMWSIASVLKHPFLFINFARNL